MSWLSIVQKVVDEKSYKYINEDTYEEVEDVEYVSELDEDYREELKPRKNKNTVLLDGFTANMLLTVANALNDENREKFLNLPLYKAVNVGWKLVS